MNEITTPPLEGVIVEPKAKLVRVKDLVEKLVQLDEDLIVLVLDCCHGPSSEVEVDVHTLGEHDLGWWEKEATGLKPGDRYVAVS